MRLYGGQYQVGAARGLSRISTRVGRRVYYDKVDALHPRLLNGSTESSRMRRNDPGHFGITAVGPFRGGRLRIGITYGPFASRLDGRDGQCQGEGSFANTAFFSNDSNNH